MTLTAKEFKLKRMKKLAAIFLFTLIFFLKEGKSVLAVNQEDLDISINKFNQSADYFKETANNFSSAKANYLVNKTGDSEDILTEKAKQMMAAKIEMLVNYLTALREKLALVTNVIDYQENLSFIHLDNEISEWKNAKVLVLSVSSLADLEKFEQSSKTKYLRTHVVANKTLGLIFVHGFEALILKSQETITILENNLTFLDTSQMTAVKSRLEIIKETLKSSLTKSEAEKKVFLANIEKSSEPELIFANYTDKLYINKKEQLNWLPSVEEITNLIFKR